MRNLLALLVLLLPAYACTQAVDATQAVASITEADFYQKTGVMAHDSMMGRNTPSPGLDMASEWVGAEFEKYGLEPGGDDGGFLQRYAIQQVGTDLEASGVTIGGGEALRFGENVGVMFGNPPDGEVTGGVVVLSGTENAESALEGVELSGKHLILALPSGAAQGRMFQVLRPLMNAGTASITILSDASDADWEEAMAEQRDRVQSRVGGGEGGGFNLTLLTARAGAVAPMLSGHGVNVSALMRRGGQAMRMQEIDGLEMSVTVRSRVVEETTAPNVVGIVEGTDLRDEYVVFSAHSDHVGYGSPDDEGDSIYNGADDNASGTIGIVELAEAFAMMHPAPRRSLIFVAVSGEEKGLWGSQYFVENPPVPLEQMVADINIDMIGRNWPDTIVAIGMEHSDLGGTLTRVGEAHPELNMAPIDDRWPEQGFYSRSDHINWARRGVPILFFFNGTHEDRHGVNDELDRMDSEKAARITQLLFYLGLEIANADAAPQWNPESYDEIVTVGG
ncbi:M28 family peptidase [Gemmatimonadota bacterium]